MRVYSVAVVLLSVPMLQSAVSAQVIEPPARPSPRVSAGGRPPEAARTRQQLTLRLNLLGGYDDNLAPDGAAVESFVSPHPSGYVGFSDATLQYSVGRDGKSFEVSGRGLMNTYRNIGVTPSYGAGLNARARTTIRRSNELALSQSVQYDPFFSLGAFGSLASDTGPQVPDSNPTNALTERRSLTSDTAASLSRHWTRRTTTDLTYSFRRQTYVDGGGYDGDTHAGSLALDRAVGRSGGIRAAYRQSDSRFIEPNGAVLPSVDRTMDLGFRYERRLSRTRGISFSGGAGATYIDTIDTITREPREYWAPSGYGTARLDVGRSWSVAADYRRSVSILYGVTPQLFVTDAAAISAGGFFTRRVKGVFTTAYSNGVPGGSQGEQDAGYYDLYTGTAQLQFGLTRWWSAVVSFNRYRYQLNSVASRSLGVSPEMDRNAVRVGFTWSLPLYGSSIEHTEPLGGPGN